jgi:serine/threonine protein kinase/tetratricopeptide (TPR) repeat protein
MILPAGTRLGSYEIVAPIGAGGMGEVYRARDNRLDRIVAVKVLPEGLAVDADRLVRFEKEARLASSLNHPNIVTIHEIGQEGSVHFIVMEYVDGRTLREAMAEGPLSLAVAADIAAQAADGLAKAHAAGIVHRDIKPANLMITTDGFVKILDFGLSKIATPSAALDSGELTMDLGDATRAGTILGTADYMSPEQAAGRHVDFRTDQFSLGLVLYEMTTGKKAFHRDTAIQTMAAIIEGEAKPVEALNPTVPAALAGIIDRCLSKAPDARYPSTKDLARDLAAVRDELSSSLPARSTTHRRTWAVAAVVVLLTLTAAWRFAEPLRQWTVRSGMEFPAEKQIAVLPFTTIGGDANDKILCDGLTETLTSKLTQLEQFGRSLRVVPASEVRARNISSVDEARRAFATNLAITGSFQRVGDKVRININLVDARTLRQLRTLPIDTRLDDVSVMQDGVVARIANLLEIELQPRAKETLTAGGTTVADAYLLYLQALGYLQRFDKPENVDGAAQLFRQALSKDESYALAHAGLGEAYWRKYQLTKDREWIALARESCARAVALNNTLAPVHVTLGVLSSGTGQPEQAIMEFQEALRLDPASVDAYRELASAYVALGRLHDVETTYQQALRARPNDWASYTRLGAFYVRQARYAEAESAFRVVTQLTPDNYNAYTSLGATYVQMGRYADAVAMLEKSMNMTPSYAAASNLGTAYFYQGQYKRSAAAFERALAIDNRNYRVWRNLGAAYRLLTDQQAQARAAYERAAAMAEADLDVNRHQPEVLVHLADCYAMLNQPARARSYLQQALELASGDVALLFTAGNVYEQLGDRDQALDAIGRAIRQGYSLDQVQRAPELANLRADPRYRRLIDAVKPR